MPAHRATILLSAAVASLTLTVLPASAQVPDGVVLNIMRECAKIGDPTARLACYDNNIRQAGATPSTGQAVPQQSRSAGSPPVPAPTATPQGFGSESVRVRETPQQQSAQAADQVREVQARVTSITAREPGIYLMTLDDGAQWLFAEGVPASYRVPTAGSNIEIERGALGSFLMRFNGQRVVPVRRIR